MLALSPRRRTSITQAVHREGRATVTRGKVRAELRKGKGQIEVEIRRGRKRESFTEQTVWTALEELERRANQ